MVSETLWVSGAPFKVGLVVSILLGNNLELNQIMTKCSVPFYFSKSNENPFEFHHRLSLVNFLAGRSVALPPSFCCLRTWGYLGRDRWGGVRLGPWPMLVATACGPSLSRSGPLEEPSPAGSLCPCVSSARGNAALPPPRLAP